MVEKGGLEMVKDTIYYKKLEKLLHDRGYIDYLLEELETNEGMRMEVRKVINACVIRTMDMMGADIEDIKEMESMLR